MTSQTLPRDDIVNVLTIAGYMETVADGAIANYDLAHKIDELSDDFRKSLSKDDIQLIESGIKCYSRNIQEMKKQNLISEEEIAEYIVTELLE